MSTLHEMIAERRAQTPAVSPDAIGGLLDHLRTNMFQPIPSVDGAIVNANGWSCRIRVMQQGQCMITVTPEKKLGNEHAKVEPHTCSLREISAVIQRETTVAPMQRAMRSALQSIERAESLEEQSSWSRSTKKLDCKQQ